MGETVTKKNCQNVKLQTSKYLEKLMP